MKYLLVLILTPIAALGSVLNPALVGLMSRMASDDQQGELQGMLTSANALATIVAPLVMTSAFAAFTGAAAPVYLPGAPFQLSMVLMGAALVVFVRIRPPGG